MYNLGNIVTKRNGTVNADLLRNGVVVATVHRQGLKGFQLPFKLSFKTDAQRDAFNMHCDSNFMSEIIDTYYIDATQGVKT